MAGPWEQYQTPAGAGVGPWTQYKTDKSTGPAGKVAGKKPSDSAADAGDTPAWLRVLTAPERFFDAVGAGAMKAGVGALQAVGDVVAPSATNRATAAVNQSAKEDKGVAPSGPVESMGDFVGGMLPAAVATGGFGTAGTVVGAALRGGAIGAGVGATGYEPGATAGERLTDRAIGAGVGAGTAGVVGAGGAVVSKLANSKEIQSIVDTARKTYTEMDPALSEVKGNINKQVDRLRTLYDSKAGTVLTKGDAIGPLNLSTIEQPLRDLAEGTGRAVNPNKKAQQILDNVVDVLVPEKNYPKTLTVGGRTFANTGGGKYEMAGGYSLPNSVRDKVIAAAGNAPAEPITYSHVKSTLEEMDAYLKDNDAKDPATQALRDARTTVSKYLDGVKTPGVKRAETAAQRFYDENLAKFDAPGIKDLMATTDPLERANKALDIALGGDVKSAATVAEAIGKDGRQAVKIGAFKKAFDSAWDRQSGAVDGAKFVKFFEDKKPLNEFLEPEDFTIVKGVENLLTERAQRTGATDAVKFGHPGTLGFLPAFEAFARGDFQKAAVEMSVAALATPAFKAFEHVLSDKFGRTLLGAAASAKPGSPRMARIATALSQKFAPVAAGTEGADLSAGR